MILKELTVNGITRITGNLLANDIYGDLNGVAAAAKCDHLGNVINTYYQPKLVSGSAIKAVGGKSILGSGNLSSADFQTGIQKFTLTCNGITLKMEKFGSPSELQLLNQSSPAASALSEYKAKLGNGIVIKAEAITYMNTKFQFSMDTNGYSEAGGPEFSVGFFPIEGLHSDTSTSYSIKELTIYYVNI